jgi:hypothetical protein
MVKAGEVSVTGTVSGITAGGDNVGVSSTGAIT